MRQWLFSSVCLFIFPAWLWAGTLENPAPDSLQSGAGVVFGWKCSAGAITVRFDGGAPVPATYGSPRGDTLGACGDEQNGYVLLWNWNLLSPGDHVVEVFDDGQLFASTLFTVVSTGVEFLHSQASSTIPNFPFSGDVSTLTWSEATQSFQLTAVEKAGPNGAPFVAGKWLLSLDFVSEDCNWAEAPSQPTGTDILDLSQEGSALSGLVPSVTLPITGVVKPDEEFSLTTSNVSRFLDTTCLLHQSFVFGGNFLTGTATTTQEFNLSGACGTRNTCAREFTGTIRFLDESKRNNSFAGASEVSRAAEESSILTQALHSIPTL